MQFFSTRGAGPINLDKALVDGIASDGGLFIPEALPTFAVEQFDGAEDIGAIAKVLLRPFFEGSSQWHQCLRLRRTAPRQKSATPPG